MTRQEATQKIRAIVGERGDVQANRTWCFIQPNKQAEMLVLLNDLKNSGFETAMIDRSLTRISIELP